MSTDNSDTTQQEKKKQKKECGRGHVDVHSTAQA